MNLLHFLALEAEAAWLRLRKNKYFIAFRGFFLGSVVSAVEARYQAGSFDLTFQSLQCIVVTGAVAAAIAVWHFYLTPPKTPTDLTVLPPPAPPTPTPPETEK